MAYDARFGDDETPPIESEQRAVTDLSRDLERVDLAPHVAFFYRSPETQLKVATTFVRHALNQGYRCLYFFDTNTEERILAALRSTDIDVEARLEAGDLLIHNGAEAYGETGFSPEGLIDQLEAASHESQSEGYEELWVAGEVTWCFHTDLSYDNVVGFEADFDAASRDLPMKALCQYDLNQFSEQSVAKALWTHRQIIYRYTVCENPYYITPEKFKEVSDGALTTQLMLEQMHDITRSERQVERQGQRLSVVNRILRHNIRNNLLVIRGMADLVARSEDIPDHHQEKLSTAITNADEIIDIAEKAREVEETTDQSTRQTVTLEGILDSVTDQLRGTYREAVIDVDGPATVQVVVDENIDTALAELGLYALQQQNSTSPRLQLVVETPSPEIVCVELHYDGGPMPDSDRRVLTEGVETQLNHCHGLGLWLAKWIVENGNGRLHLPEDGEAHVVIELQRERDGSA